MKTTFVIDDELMLKLREEAARQGWTVSELVETALRLLLEQLPLPPLPSFNSGGALVDIANREALNEAMEAP